MSSSPPPRDVLERGCPLAPLRRSSSADANYSINIEISKKKTSARSSPKTSPTTQRFSAVDNWMFVWGKKCRRSLKVKTHADAAAVNNKRLQITADNNCTHPMGLNTYQIHAQAHNSSGFHVSLTKRSQNRTLEHFERKWNACFRLCVVLQRTLL